MKLILVAVLLFACVSPTIANAGQVFNCINESGNVSYRDRPCEKSGTSNGTGSTLLSVKNLQGKWLITKVGDIDTRETDMGKDLWEFKGDQWIVRSSGNKMNPETFSVISSGIKMGRLTIKVLEFSPGEMKVDSMGIIQHLTKQ